MADIKYSEEDWRRRALTAEAEVKNLRATVCRQPTAASCAMIWESDHQQHSLREVGLADEFPFGCDSIGFVADALLSARAEVLRLFVVLQLCATHAGHPDVAEGCRLVIRTVKDSIKDG